MKRNYPFRTLGICLLSIALFCCGCTNAGKSIKIAGNLPLSGPVAAWSGQYPNGFRMGIEDAGSTFGVPTSQFSVDFQDNQGTATNSVSVFQKQALQSPDVYISGSSEAAIAIAKQVDALKIPNFIAAFDPYLVREGANRLRIMPNSKIEGPLFVKYAQWRNAKKVFIINLNSAYANSEVDSIIIPGLDGAGIEHRRELYDFNQRDFRNLVLKAKDYSPDLTFAIGYSFHLKPLIRDLRTTGLVRNGSVMGAMDVVDMLYDNTPREDLLGISFACPNFEITGLVPSAEDFRKRFSARFGRRPTYVEAYAHDTAALIVKAFKESGKDTTETLRAALPIQGVTGSVNVDKDGDIIATVTVAHLTETGSVEQVNPSDKP